MKGGLTQTFNSEMKHGHLATDSGYTYGGYSAQHTLNQRFLVKIPDSLSLEKAAPVLCAGITMYSPLAHWKATQGNYYKEIKKQSFMKNPLIRFKKKYF